MKLSSEILYNDLSGEDVKEILLTRFADLLNSVPELKRHLTLPRVRMNLLVHLEVNGRTPPSFDIRDELVVRMRDIPPALPNQEEIHEERDLEAEINSDTLAGGQPPDQIREEHGLPVIEPERTAMGIQDKTVVRPEGIRYAFNVTQDYGPARARTGAEGPIVGGEVIAKKNMGATPEVGPNFSRVKDPGYRDPAPDKE